MLVFDEEKKAKELLATGKFSSKNICKEIGVICRYWVNNGVTKDEMIKRAIKLDAFNRNMINIAYYVGEASLEDMYRGIINNAMEYPYVTGIKCDIYKREVDVINSLKKEDEKRLLFAYLVHFKWSSKIAWRVFPYNKYDWVIDDELDIFKIAGLGHLRKEKRNKMIKSFYERKLFDFCILKTKYRYTLPWVSYEGDVAFTIENYDNIEDYLYLCSGKGIICSRCGKPAERLYPHQKYCSKCSAINKRERARIRKNRQIHAFKNAETLNK